MPGVTVTVTGTGLQLPRVAVTTETGAYQFPNIPIGTYAVTFELQGFKKATRPNILIVTGFNAPVDQALEVGTMTEEVTVSGATPIVDTEADDRGRHVRRADAREDSDRARPLDGHLHGAGRAAQRHQRRRVRVGRAADDLIARHQRQRPVELEGGATTDLRSNTSASYYNFDALEQIQVINGGGDVSVQSSGISINLITKSGSNMFKGSAVGTLTNDAMQFQNVSEELFKTRAPAASCRARRSIASPT